MDFSIVEGSNGNPEVSWEKPTNIATNIYTSLMIKKGSLFNTPSFGLDLSDIKKVTATNIKLIETRLRDALQWLIDIGKAKTINVIVERDSLDRSRINYKVEAVQADGIPVIVSYFRTVGGAADDFSI